MAKRVLIVEDDRSCESVLRKIIQTIDASAEVDWVESAEVAALTLVQEQGRGKPYDLVIADIFLRGKLTGLDLWRICRELEPRAPVVLTSTLPVQEFFASFPDLRDVPPFLSKPLFTQECREVVRRFVTGS